jgi:AAA15 family ATPase/GTPase
MLKKLSVQNFTTFDRAEFNFSSGINIIIGENSSGKSHVLKLAYSVASVWDQCGKEGWKDSLINKLHRVFRVEELIELKKNNTLLGDGKHSISLEFSVSHKSKDSQSIAFDLVKRDKIAVNGVVPSANILKKPLFFPAKEVLSLFPKFMTLYDKYELSFDETYYDLCKAIDNPLLKEPNWPLIEKIEQNIGGKITMKGDHFYLQTEQGEFNIFMVAEGFRKLGTLSYLIANDSLRENSILFWDEPEANLNPRMIKQLAAILFELSRQNVQIIIATHSLFLMKYFDYLVGSAQPSIPTTFFSLVRGDKGVTVERGERLSQLATIVSLNEELELYDKEQELICANL